MLDLGCGDAHAVRKAFPSCQKISYCGVDQSKQALAIAEKELNKTDWDVDLLNIGIVDLLSKLGISFDLVIAGYSLHHLSDRDKAYCLRSMRKLTVPEGQCIIYDLLPEAEESRDAYIERFLDDALQDWGALSLQQLNSIREHVKQQDQPIDFARWTVMALEAGFTQAKLLYRDPQQHYGFIELS